MALRDEILSAADLPTVAVEVPEWGATVYVRSMNGSERDQYEVDLMETQGKPLKVKLKDMRAKLVVLTTVDADGNRVFSEDDVELVGAKNAKALSRIVEESQKLNGLSDNDIEDIAEN